MTYIRDFGKNLSKLFICVLGLLFLQGSGKVTAQPVDYARQVNTMIGTAAAGNTYPGATYPFGMVQFTRPYYPGQLGFGINQLSGAGCSHMGNFPVIPVKDTLKISPDSILNLRTSITNESGYAGYYQAMVDGDIQTELTVTKRSGMAAFSYPQKSAQGTVIIGGGVAATPTGEAVIVITGKNSCEGYAKGGNFCGISTPYKVYFVAEFDQDAAITGIWKKGRLTPGGRFAEGAHSGVYFTFRLKGDKKAHYKIGVSYVSVDNARKNLKAENKDWDFDKVKAGAVAAWNRYLGKIEVKGDNPSRVKQFYTSLYHAMIHPNICSDVNGQYRGADNNVYKSAHPQYTSFSNWDTYRTQIQLLSMLSPDIASDIVSSLEGFALQSGGGFPRWVLANTETGIMQGDPTTILIANAFAFGARNYDARQILTTMLHGAEDPTANSQGVLTRPGLAAYKKNGYYDASVALEYYSADFAISRFALGASDDQYLSAVYLQRAQGWKKLYNPERRWLQSRDDEGKWKAADADWREATYKNYFWMIPFNLKALIDTIGGKQAALQRLDKLFSRIDANYGQDWFASGNEPSFATPWVYNWVGAPYKAQSIVHRIIKEQYFDRPDGLPGNDDLGAMGAFYVFCCMGMFPEIPAVGGLSLSSPIFSEVTIHLPKGDLLLSGGSEQRPYILNLQLNGKKYESTWLPWSLVENGGELRYKLSAKPDKKWGTRIAPPSFN